MTGIWADPRWWLLVIIYSLWAIGFILAYRDDP